MTKVEIRFCATAIGTDYAPQEDLSAVVQSIETLVERAVADEREACAKTAEARIQNDDCEACRAAALIAKDIRNRGAA